VMMDRYLLERIMFNLLSNAAKFTSKGKVDVTVRLDGDQLSISVSDTGIGIPESEQKNLFQKFSQVEGSSTRRFEGTGLGLAMVKEFAELLGGPVSVESVEGKGSTFTVKCLAPRTTAKPKNEIVSNVKFIRQLSELPIALSGNGNENNDYAKMKVLVCEDNQELLTYIVSLLQNICSIKTASNGVEALHLVRSWEPDLVLSDVMMPEKDGIAVCKEIKSDESTSKIIVVLLTALTHREAMLKGWEAKADEYLFKPFHPEELITRISSLLSVIKQRKKSDELLKQKNDELVKVINDLESFSYSVSHDLRAPLRAVSGYTRALEEDYANALDDDGKKLLHTILRNTSKMNDLIDDLLSFSKLDRKEITKSGIDMESFVRQILDEVNANTNHRADIQMNPILPAWADPSLLNQVWINLLSNAIKYSSKKEKPVVEIGSQSQNSEIIYYVRDNGAGFDMNYASKLFGVFQRLHKSNEFEGTGIGLALVKRIVTKHGGRVWAEGQEGNGATFYFTLPNRVSENQ
jgi:signal transduction histidine kinase